MSFLDDKGVLVTGGTGSFGKKFVDVVLRRHKPRRLVVFSRDELKQYEMAQTLSPEHRQKTRFFLGDVRDEPRLRRALEDIDIVVHAAALKQVPAAEYNPFEFIKTNILGAQNLVTACLDQGVQRVVALSTDKAAAPINLYGATKLCSDKLFVAANHFKGKRNLKLSVVRYGNVLGSRGSVIPLFMSKRSEGVIPITSPDMTRFNITLDQGVDQVLFALEYMWGGEIFVPKIPSFRITDVAEAVAPGCRTEIIGVRPGEKLHEMMITETDAQNSLEFPQRYVICPSAQLWDTGRYARENGGHPCVPGFSYDSLHNDQWLTVDELRELIRLHVDPKFAWTLDASR
ncbi:MAG: UDP-N-acetylglucosamine 4,6-dehydratase (inverting) [Pseudomonadota bacterium]